MTLFVFMGLFVRKLLGDFFFFFFLNREQNAGADSPGWKLFKKKKISLTANAPEGEDALKGGESEFAFILIREPPHHQKK